MYDDDIQAETILDFKKNGVNTTQMKHLKRAQHLLSIDLHGLTQLQAKNKLNYLLSSNHPQMFKIVHGKGQHNPEAIPVLKIMVYHFLKDDPSVLAFCSAKPNDGGAGATYVLTKKEGV
ncbi:MAG: Smr/MutS family protein [Gammaproteobacteria bacterium]|nr:Smr/MutS family protein [Gammaproteobacteria bacterium]